MTQISTKDKIKQAAVTAFNREGLANARLQHIADAANLSVGNLTYHFRTKEDVVRAVWEQIVLEQRLLLNEFRVLPLLEDIERLLVRIFELQGTYTFFYLDTLEVMRALPDIQAEYHKHLQWQVQQMQLALEFNCSRMAMQWPATDGPFSQVLAAQFWTTADTWKYRCSVQGQPHDQYLAFRRTLWNLLIPCLTHTGQQEYKQLIINAPA